MKKSILLFAFMLASVGMIAQTTLKAQSLYDVNQDDQVSISDVSTVAKKVVENAATDKTVVDTEALLTVLNKLNSDIALIKAKLGIEDEAEDTPEDTHEYVDLGLPSGTLWATCNIGAENPEDYGLYFAWGETTGYTSDTSDGHQFNWANYKWMTSGQSSWKGCTKYTFADGQTSGCWYSNDTYVGTTVDGTTYTNLTELESADDAATANWGSKWCMPTHAQQQELVNSSYTSTEWTTVNGVYGRKITSLSNGNSLFLPAAGCRSSSYLSSAGSYGDYWSSGLTSDYSDDAWILNFGSSYVDTSSSLRCCGQSVRAVRSAQ